MKIIEQRYLRGASLYGRQPCLLTVLDLDGQRPFDTDSLLALLPGLRQRLARDAGLPDIVAQLVMELQYQAGSSAGFSQVDAVRGSGGVYRIACGYDLDSGERVAGAAFDGAIALIDALAMRREPDLAGLLDRLRTLARRAVIDQDTAAVLAQARQRGIPVMRGMQRGQRFQLGWGSRQRHLPRPVPGGDVIASLFGNGDGRIPLIAVTGTNGKTTTTRLIAHAASMTGLVTGMTTTEGVYLDGVRIKEGDCTGYHSARTILASPQVELAVLETARGGILKRGLAFDRCDVSVVLNVTADHLGLDGVETLQDLARVKQVVAGMAGIVVLNADDAMCVAMAPQLRGTAELLYFSMDEENPVLLRHLADGGRAVYLHDQMLVLADGERHVNLLDARKAPVTMQGKARHNIANALAAACALAATGFTPREIARGLAGFVSDGRSNPLRGNVFDVDGVQVIVDFAHNAAAYAALAGMARAMTGGRLVGVVSAPGDRRECDLREIGAVCAAGFDDIVIYESENRGRPYGEVARLLTLGACEAGRQSSRHYCKIDVHHAIRFGLKLCKPGDLLVFGCGSSIDELLDAIRLDHPEAADRIQAEVEPLLLVAGR